MSISITPLTTDLNAHQNLPAQPSLTSAELKIAWDKPVNDIKTYLNSMTQGTEDGTLKHEIEEAITEGVNTSKGYTDDKVAALSFTASNISYDNTSSGLTADDVQEGIDELNTKIGTTGNAKTVYSDFAVSTGNKQVTLAKGGTETGTITLSKSGYYPLGIVGMNNSANIFDLELTRYQLTSRSNGSATITYTIRNDMGNQYTTTLYFDVLWIKIR